MFPQKANTKQGWDSWHPALLPPRGQCCPSLMALAAAQTHTHSSPHPEIPDLGHRAGPLHSPQAAGLVSGQTKLGSCTQGRACPGPDPKAGAFSANQAAHGHLWLCGATGEYLCQLKISSSRTLLLPTNKLKGETGSELRRRHIGLASLPRIPEGHCIPSLTLKHMTVTFQHHVHPFSSSNSELPRTGHPPKKTRSSFLHLRSPWTLPPLLTATRPTLPGAGYRKDFL